MNRPAFLVLRIIFPFGQAVATAAAVTLLLMGKGRTAQIALHGFHLPLFELRSYSNHSPVPSQTRAMP